MYKLVPTRRFIKQLKKLDRYTQKLITNYLQINVLEDPRRHGKALVGNRVGQWRYRIGNYRVIVQIVDDELVVGLITFQEKLALLALLGAGLVLLVLYLPYQVKRQMQD
ncbi:cytotoxic translational repressor of toxin-antitoxin stability system [Streptococcus pneumoniae]|nr:cytotoxic translational repressor of toxin-antitoxin stability system [Streptococcus pneumoniae]